MTQLNFHHLRYFWSVAKEGNLTRAAHRLHVSQSALSAQIKQLEVELGQPLFYRTGRTLTLTEAGQVALTYAEGIFASGTELVEVLRDGRREERQILRIGAVATASRNFQENFIRPVLDRDDVELVLVSASLPELLARLRLHSIDLVLCNQRVHGSKFGPVFHKGEGKHGSVRYLVADLITWRARPYVLPRKRRLTPDVHSRVARIGRAEPHTRGMSLEPS